MSPLLDCPKVECWQALLDVELPAELRDRYQVHLDSCPACQDRIDRALDQEEDLLRLARLVGDPTSRPADPCLSRVLEGLHQAKIPERPTPAEEVDLYFLQSSDRPELLGTLGPYEILEVIGQGGMGVVLKGYEPALRRFVAIKVLASALAGSAVARKRFTREAQSAAAVCHDHIVGVYGVAEADGLPYLVCQYIAGESLQARLDRTGPPEVADIVEIGLKTARGLAAAHAQGLIHRDIKPANLLIADCELRIADSKSSVQSAIRNPQSAIVKITDFGLARSADDVGLTQNGVVAGTPQFMAPEQARGEVVDHRADLFSLGSVLYTLCTGVPPFRGSTAVSVLRQVSDLEAGSVRSVNPAVPDWLDALIARLMAKDPASRFQSASEVADLLERYLAHLRQPTIVSAPPLPSGTQSFKKGYKKNRFNRLSSLSFCLLVLFVLGSGIAFLLAGGGDDPAAKPEPGTEYHQYHLPLRGQPESLPQVKLEGAHAHQWVRFEPAGMRLTVPPGFKGIDAHVSLNTGIALKGDFEVTVNYEILQLPEPAMAGPETGVTLCAWRIKSNICITGATRRVVENNVPQFAAWATWFEQPGKPSDHKGEVVPTEAKSGRLRLVRIGGELSYYASDGPDADLTLLNQLSIGEQEMDAVRLIGFTGDPRSSLDARFSDLHIRMGSLPAVPEAPQEAESKGWLGTATAAGVVLFLLLGLALFLRRRRSRAIAPLATPAEDTPAGTTSFVFFSCSCGKSLRGKPELAGKKVRCPACGSPIRVPGPRDDSPSSLVIGEEP